METIKAERVNDFVKGSTSYWTMNVSVKVKNKVYEIEIDYKKDYSRDSDNDYKTDIMPITRGIAETFAELDIEVDYSDIIAEYHTLRTEWKAEVEAERIAEKKKEWKESWVHGFKKELKDDYDLEVTFVTEKEYVEKNIWSVLAIVHYNGYEVSVSYGNVSGTRYGCKDMRYTMDNSITNYKRRNYKKIKSLVKKLKELVDEDIDSKKRQKEYEEEKKQKKEERDNLIERLKTDMKVDGVEIEVGVNETRSSYSYHSHEDGIKVVYKWEGGLVKAVTRDKAETFKATVLTENVDADTLKRFVAHVKSFS